MYGEGGHPFRKLALKDSDFAPGMRPSQCCSMLVHSSNCASQSWRITSWTFILFLGILNKVTLKN